MKPWWGGALGAVLALGVGGCWGESLRNQAPERILLISMDTVRADHVLDPRIAPELATIARQGVVFPRFHAASNYTLPSHMSIFTGLDPIAHGVIVGAARLAPEVSTLAEILAEAGYKTQSFNESGYVASRYGFDRGFEEYVELPQKAVVRSALPAVVDWIRAQRDERWFLFLHTYTAHFPYGGYERYRTEHPQRGLLDDAEIAALRDRSPRQLSQRGRAAGGFPPDVRARCTLFNQLADDYNELLGCGYNWLPRDPRSSPDYHATDLDAVVLSYEERIREIDQALGRIRDTLQELGQWDDTLVVITSDHGEAFFEHGTHQHDFSPFQEVLRVPLVVSHPARLGGAAGRSVDALAWHLDLLPTILGLAGIQAPEDRGGSDLTPLILGTAETAPQRALFPVVMSAPNRTRRPSRRVTLRGPLKSIEGYPAFGDAEGLLFDLRLDPQEQRNLRSARPAEFAELTALAQGYSAGLRRHAPVNSDTGEPIDLGGLIPSPQLSPDEEEMLRGLGYLE